MAKCKVTGKVRYRDEVAAKIALARLVWKDHGEIRFYRCPHCNGFHTTHKRKGGRNRR